MEDDKENLVSCSPDSGVCCELEPRPVSRVNHRLDPSLLACNRRLTLLKSLSADSEYSLDTSLFDAEEFLQDMGFAGSSDPTIPDRFLPSLLQRLSRFPEAEMESLHDRIIQSIGCFRRKEGKRRLFRNLSMGKDSRVEHYGKNLLICPPANNYPLLRSNTGPASFPFEEGTPETLKAPRLVAADSGHGSLDPACDDKSIPESPIAILVSAASTEAEGSLFDSRQTSLDETSDTEDNDFCTGDDTNQFSETIEELQKLTEQLSEDREDLQSEAGQDELECRPASDVVKVDCSDGMTSQVEAATHETPPVVDRTGTVVSNNLRCNQYNGPETPSVVDVASTVVSNNRRNNEYNIPEVSSVVDVTSPVIANNSSEPLVNDGKNVTVLKHPLRRTSNAHRYDFKNPNDPFGSLSQALDPNPDQSPTIASSSEIVEYEPALLDGQMLDQSLDDCSDDRSKDGTEELNSDIDSDPVCSVFQFDRTTKSSFSKPKYTRDDSLTHFLSSMLDTTDEGVCENVPLTGVSEAQRNTDGHALKTVSPNASLKENVAKVPNRKRRVLKRMSSSMQCCDDDNCRHHDGLHPDAEQKDVAHVQDVIGPPTESFPVVDRQPKVALRITNSAPLSSDSRYMPPCGSMYQNGSHNVFKVNFASAQYRSKNGTQNAHRRKERRPCKRRRYLSCPSPQNFNFVPNFFNREISASMRDLHSTGWECPMSDPRQQCCGCCESASFSDSSVRYHPQNNRRLTTTTCPHHSPREQSPVRSGNCFRNPGGYSTADPFPSRSSFPSRLSSTLPKYYLCNSSPDVRCVSPELVRTQSGHKQFSTQHQFRGFFPSVNDVFAPNTCCCLFHCDASFPPGAGNMSRHHTCQNYLFCVDSDNPFSTYGIADSDGRYSKGSDSLYKHSVSRQFSSSRLSQCQNNLSFSDSEVPFLANNISATKNGSYAVPKKSETAGPSAFMGHYSPRNLSSDRLPRCQNFCHADSEALFSNDVSMSKNDHCRSVPKRPDMACRNPEQFPADRLQNNMSYAVREAPFSNNTSINKSNQPKNFNVDAWSPKPSKSSERFSSENLPRHQNGTSYSEAASKNNITASKYGVVAPSNISGMAYKQQTPPRVSGQLQTGCLSECQKNMSYTDCETRITDMMVTKKDQSCVTSKGTDLSYGRRNSRRISGQFSTDRLPQRQNSVSYADADAPFADYTSNRKDSRGRQHTNGVDVHLQHSGSSRIQEQFSQPQDNISFPEFDAAVLERTVGNDDRNCSHANGSNPVSKRPSTEVPNPDPFAEDCPPPSPDTKREPLLEKKIRIFSKFLANLGNLSKSVTDNKHRNRKLSYAASLPDKRTHAPPTGGVGGARKCATPPPRLLDCHHPKDSMNPNSVQDDVSPTYENRVLLQPSGEDQKYNFTPVMFTSSVSMYIGGNGDVSKSNSEESEEPPLEHCQKSSTVSHSTVPQMPFNVVSKELEDLQLSIQKAKEMRLCASKELHLLQALLAGDEPNKEKRFETTLQIETSPVKELALLKDSETLADLKERAKKRDEGEEASFWQEEIKKVKKETEEAWKAKLDRMESRLESQEEELQRLQSDNENLQKTLESQTFGSPVCQCKSDGLLNGFGRIDSAFEDDEEYLAHKPSIPIQPTRQECERLQERLMEEEQRADQLNILLNQKLIEMNKLQLNLSKQTKEMIELEKSYVQLQCRLKRGQRPALPRLCSRESPFASKNLCPGPSPPASPHP